MCVKNIEDQIIWLTELLIEGGSYSNTMGFKDGKLKAAAWK